MTLNDPALNEACNSTCKALKTIPKRHGRAVCGTGARIRRSRKTSELNDHKTRRATKCQCGTAVPGQERPCMCEDQSTICDVMRYGGPPPIIA
ncbi:hypothetical protein Hdeb2414_s0009g00318021 [Helianthus debilis subsp. tardiflorus]